MEPAAPQEDANLFAFLREMDARRLSQALTDESVSTVSLVLAHTDRALAAQVLADFTPPVRTAVLKAMRGARAVPRETLRSVAEGLRERLAPTRQEAVAFARAGARSSEGAGRPSARTLRYGGPHVAAAMLRHASPHTRRMISEAEPELYNRLRRFMFTLDDFLHASDRAIQALAGQIETPTLALALKVAVPDLRDRFLDNLSDRRAQLVREEIDALQRVSLREVERAQGEVVEQALGMQARGQILLDRDGELV